MIRQETKDQIKFTNYLREQNKKGLMYGFYELKVTNLESLAFSKIEIHQYDGLQATEHSGLVWKWSDQDQRLKVCDCVSIPPMNSFLVIKYKGNEYYVVRIGEIVKLREGGVISITRKMAEKLATKIITIKDDKHNTYNPNPYTPYKGY